MATLPLTSLALVSTQGASMGVEKNLAGEPRAALQFKGTGWYVTDYGRNGKTSVPHGDKKPSSDTKPSSDNKPPAGKADTASAPSTAQK